MRPPKIIKPYVLKFCSSVVPDATPVYVTCRPLPDAPVNDCFPIVDRQVASAGGESVIGWAVWEWPKVFIEAEFHAVWKQPDGSLLDIAPKVMPIPRILFIPDPQRVYRGRQVANVRRPLCNDKAVKRFCELSTLIFKELNAGALADVHGGAPPNNTSVTSWKGSEFTLFKVGMARTTGAFRMSFHMTVFSETSGSRPQGPHRITFEVVK